MEKRSSKGCFAWGCGLLVGVPIALIVLTIVLFNLRERSAAQQVGKRLQKLSAEGLPFDDVTMEAFSRSRTSREDTQAWLDVFAELNGAAFQASTSGIPLLDRRLEVIIPGPAKNGRLTRSRHVTFLRDGVHCMIARNN